MITLAMDILFWLMVILFGLGIVLEVTLIAFFIKNFKGW